MTLLLLFILIVLALPHLGLPRVVNQVIAALLVVLAIVYVGWPDVAITVRD